MLGPTLDEVKDLLAMATLYSGEKAALNSFLTSNVDEATISHKVEAINQRLAKKVIMDATRNEINTENSGLTRVPENLKQYIQSNQGTISTITVDNPKLGERLLAQYPNIEIMIQDKALAQSKYKRYTPGAEPMHVGPGVRTDIDPQKHTLTTDTKNTLKK